MHSLGERARYSYQKYLPLNYYCQFEIQTINDRILDDDQQVVIRIRLERTASIEERIAVEYRIKN